MPLFFAEDGESATKIIVALELPDNDWFKRALVKALTLMCDQENWGERGTATAEFARDKSCEMNETMEFDVHIPVIPIGVVQMWLHDTMPDKWLRCDGSQISREVYAELFALWGTFFGAGDGSTTFNLPDMRSLHPKGVGGVIGLGEVNGASVVTLSVGQLPAHSHVVNDPGHVHRERVSTGVNANLFTAGGGGNSTVGSAATVGTAALNTGSATTGITIADEGLGDSIDTKQPSMGVHYIVYAGV